MGLYLLQCAVQLVVRIQANAVPLDTHPTSLAHRTSLTRSPSLRGVSPPQVYLLAFARCALQAARLAVAPLLVFIQLEKGFDTMTKGRVLAAFPAGACEEHDVSFLCPCDNLVTDALLRYGHKLVSS
jgi:hypothetical protein